MKEFKNLSLTDLIPENARPFPKILFLILILSFALNITGINWGLPSPGSRGWAADELTPLSVINGMEMKFSDGWSASYPPLQFYILSLFYLPLYLLNALKVTTLPVLTLNTIFFIIGRLVSVFMGTAIVFMVYLCGCEITDKKSALFASVITALTPPFLYYSKTANVDIPYIFWFVIAIYFFIRILKNHRTYDYILFAATAVFSICTKDQAYGLLILTPFIIIYSLHRHNKEQKRNTRILKSVFNKKTTAAFVTGTSLFLLIQNFIFNFRGFKEHVFFVTGPAKGERDFTGDIQGLFTLTIQTIKHLIFILGWPVFLICVLGLIYATAKKKKYPLLLWLAPIVLSYYFFFICIVGKNFIRFLIPLYILMSFFGALGLSSFLFQSKRLKIIGSALIILLFINSAAFSLSVDIIMVNDSRYYVEAWMRENIEKDESILFIGYINFLPRNIGFTHAVYVLHPRQKLVKEIDPSYILVNSDLLSTIQPYLYKKLINKDLGYKQILRYKSSPWLNLLPEHKIREDGNTEIITNLNLINPEIIIFQKEQNTKSMNQLKITEYKH